MAHPAQGVFFFNPNRTFGFGCQEAGIPFFWYDFSQGSTPDFFPKEVSFWVKNVN
jgi:hypothetical protein